jgi:Fe-S oxidoreductase
MAAKPVQWFLEHGAGMVDSPRIHRHQLGSLMHKLDIDWADAGILQGLPDAERQRSVVIVQDAFSSFFDTDTVADILRCLQQLGFRVWVMPYRANGKPLHVHGFLKTFTWVAKRRQKDFAELARSGIPLVGIDPSMTLAYRSEYAKYLEGEMTPVLLLQEFLGQRLAQLESHSDKFLPGSVRLLGHCTEKTNAAASMKDWQRVFSALGQTLEHEAVGCCGMSGTYGHETRNKDTSAKIYDLSWRHLLENQSSDQWVATGYSCRSQAQRQQGISLKHPLQYLMLHYQG